MEAGPIQGVTWAQATWLAYKIGKIEAISIIERSGIETLSMIRALWLQVGLGLDLWGRFEADVLMGEDVAQLSRFQIEVRAATVLAGVECPIEP